MNKLLLCRLTKFCCFFLVLISYANAQHCDSLFAQKSLPNNQYFHLKEIYAPAAFIAVASYSNTKETIINNKAIKIERDENMPHFRTHVDDYLQYAPLLTGY